MSAQVSILVKSKSFGKGRTAEKVESIIVATSIWVCYNILINKGDNLMKTKKELTKDEVEMYTRAVLEKTIYSKDLLVEILPLLKEYFIADFDITQEKIIIYMLNNQKFELTIKEIKQ